MRTLYLHKYVLVFMLLFIATFTHGYNMRGYPYFENDEGTYMSQAWSLVTQGQLAPYTYWYDHAPLGWIIIAAWTIITGGFSTFGLAVDSGRVLMLFIHVLNSVLIYSIAKRISSNRLTAVLATIIYILTPLGIYFRRRVLLDNLMLTFVLLSFQLIYARTYTLIKTILASFLMACAILTKETAIFFIPALLYYLISHAPNKQKSLFIGAPLFIFLSTVSLYFMYAAIKTELFPSPDKISLLGTLIYQGSRGDFIPFWHADSEIVTQYYEWIKRDPFLPPLGLFSTFFVTIIAFFQKNLRVLMLATWGIFAYFLRGGIVLDFYIIPALPFLCLNIALMFRFTANQIFKRFHAVAHLTVIFIATALWLSLPTPHFFINETAPQRALITHILSHVPTDAVLAIDNYALVDLRQAGYSNAQWFWKLWTDPAIYQQYTHVEYLALTHEMVKQMTNSGITKQSSLIESAYKSGQIHFFVPPVSPGTYLQLTQDNLRSTNGDWAALITNTPPPQLPILHAWQYYKQHYIQPNGQVLDPQNKLTTSEAQAYALKRARQLGDYTTFQQIWHWTQQNLQVRPSDKLFAWQADETGAIQDYANATDADLDIAFELYQASQKWQNPAYLTAATQITKDLWRHCVLEINQRLYLLPSTSSFYTETNAYLVNPSYYDPLAFKAFAMIDPIHPWEQLVDDTYNFLVTLQDDAAQPKLPPNWILIEIATGQIRPTYGIIPYNADDYGYDAFRTFYRVASDYYHTKDSRARDYLSAYQPFFEAEVATNQRISAIYTATGQPAVEHDSISTAVGAWSVLQVGNSPQATPIYQKYFVDSYHTAGYYGDAQNYYDQNWAAFATQLHYLSVIQKERGDRQ